MKFHPAAQIMTWCLLVATMQALAFGTLLITAGLILLCALVISGHKFIQLLRRTRWIMLSLLLVYAYSTPGQPLLDAFGMYGPTREGLTDGVLQLTRLLAALAGLAILLDRLHRQQLIAGLYTLFAPLQWVGLSRERFAVRLALTLHYAEVAMLRATEDRGQRTENRGFVAATRQSFKKARRSRTTFCPLSSALCHLIEDRGQRTEDRGQMDLPLSRFAVADALLLSGSLLVLWLAVR